MGTKRRAISIFGSYLPKPGEPIYEESKKTAFLLGSQGYDIITGGYDGVMAAGSEGAAQAGAKATGILVDFWGRSRGNKFLTENIVTSTLFDRLDKLTSLADGFIIMPGGTGTLLEFALVWEYLNKNMTQKKPICCYGSFWKPLVDMMTSVPESIAKPIPDIPLVFSPDEALNFFQKAFQL